MAKVVAMHAIHLKGKRVECESAAAGNLGPDGHFKCNCEVSECVKEVIRDRYRKEESPDHDCITAITKHSPQPLSAELIMRASRVIFLGHSCMKNARTKFPKELEGKTRCYCCYKTNGEECNREDCHEVPYPLKGGRCWEEFYKTKWPGTDERACRMLLETMITKFQPMITDDMVTLV